MKKTIYTLLFFLSVLNLCASTYSDNKSQKWQGINVDTIIGNEKYADVTGNPKGFPFVLYNIGTGRFVVQGGDWAMEGRLFYSDFGRTMYLCTNGRINSGITEKNIDATKNSFCTRPPEPYGKNWNNNNYSKYNFTTLMDGDSKSYNQTWTFERVENENGDTCTYYMYQTYGTTKKYYLGAVYGECHNASIGKGDGQLVYMDDDRSCWTTATVKGVTTKYTLNNGNEVELQKLYQWKLISIDEFLNVLNSDDVGLNPSISALIKDRDFTRNSIDFFPENNNPNTGWAMSRLGNHTYEDGVKKRYPYTWGDYRMGTGWKTNKQRTRGLQNQAWDSPVRLKAVFDNDKGEANGKKDAKYGFMEFEGVGSIYTNFQVTKPGWYELSVISICQSDDNDAFIFVRLISDTDSLKLESEFDIPATDTPEYCSIAIDKEPSGTYAKETYDDCLIMGKELLKNGDDHKRKIWVLVSEDDFNNGKKTIRVGIRKDNATISELTEGGYYDTDWVCIDDVRATYMGIAPAFFYEDMETLNYLDDINHEDLYIENEHPKKDKNGRYGGAISLQRKFTVNEWNTFSFPLSITGEQIRNAFGEDTKLLELDGIGTLSLNENIIDFRTINLLTTNNVITPNKLYLIKPTKNAIYGKSPRDRMEYYYDLGKMFFSTKEENSEYKYPSIDLSVIGGNNNVNSYLGRNDGIEYVTYIKTPTANIKNGTYAPKGSYVMSDGKMYEIKTKTKVKGFRGWITLEHSIFENTSTSLSFSINGVCENITSDIDNIDKISNINITNIYDITGKKIQCSISSLPSGLYIVNGKKMLVK